jgi:hypothetical protein
MKHVTQWHAALTAVLLPLFSAAHAETCTPSAKDNTGTLSSDGSCQPIPKDAAKYFDRKDDCTPDLQGRGRKMIGMKGEECEFVFQEVGHCTPPADEYIGFLVQNGECFPFRKGKYFKHFKFGSSCRLPELKGRGRLVLRGLLKQVLDKGPEFECAIPSPQPHSEPRSREQDLQQQIDELKEEIEQLKSDRKR